MYCIVAIQPFGCYTTINFIQSNAPCNTTTTTPFLCLRFGCCVASVICVCRVFPCVFFLRRLRHFRWETTHLGSCVVGWKLWLYSQL